VAHLRAPPEYQSIAAGDGDEDGAARIKIPGARELLSNPMIRYISASSGAVGFMAAAFNLFFTLLAYSDLEDGGLAMKVPQPSYSLVYMLTLTLSAFEDRHSFIAHGRDLYSTQVLATFPPDQIQHCDGVSLYALGVAGDLPGSTVTQPAGLDPRTGQVI
jgi:hypothetical protein